MDIKTVKRALRAVVERGIVRREFRIGETLRLVIAPLSEWKEPSPKDTLGQTPPQVAEWPGSEPKGHPTHLAQKTPYKGSPIEGNPFKVLPKQPDLPITLQTDRLKIKWAEWMAYRKGLKGCKDFPALFTRQAEWLAQFDEPTAFESLCQSMRNGWQGLFPPKRSAAPSRHVPRPKPNDAF